MTKEEFTKVVLTFCLLFYICFIGLVDNCKKVRELTKQGVKVPYPYYDKKTKSAKLPTISIKYYQRVPIGIELKNEAKIYRRSLNWWLQDFGDITILFCMACIWFVNANLSAGGFNFKVFWIFYFGLMGLDRFLFLGRLQWDQFIEVFMMSLQLCYTAYCFLLWKPHLRKYIE